jgi:hypothetical protein
MQVITPTADPLYCTMYAKLHVEHSTTDPLWV